MAIKTSLTRTNAYKQYQTSKRWETNRIKRLKRALKKNPENTQIETALKDVNYRRKTPKTHMWSKTNIRKAMLFKEFTGGFNKDIMSSNEKLVMPALMTPGWKSKKFVIPTNGSMFAIGLRIT
jgi:hypothetical protein